MVGRSPDSALREVLGFSFRGVSWEENPGKFSWVVHPRKVLCLGVSLKPDNTGEWNPPQCHLKLNHFSAVFVCFHIKSPPSCSEPPAYHPVHRRTHTARQRLLVPLKSTLTRALRHLIRIEPPQRRERDGRACGFERSDIEQNARASPNGTLQPCVCVCVCVCV